jgi:hypothetical protein
MTRWPACGLVLGVLGLVGGCFEAVPDRPPADAGDTQGDGDPGDGDPGDGDPGDGDPGDGDPGDGDPGDGDPGDGDPGDGDGDPGDGDLPPGVCLGSDDCAADEYCDFPDNFCGDLALGECTPRPDPTSCSQGFEVTGCDCVVYPSTCIAAAMGADFKCIGSCC